MSEQTFYAGIIVVTILLILVGFLLLKISRRGPREQGTESPIALDTEFVKGAEISAPESDETPAVEATTAKERPELSIEHTDWIESEEVSQELARLFVKACAYWDHPAAYRWVRAPGHAANLYKSSFGWTVDFGANSFLVEKAIERSREKFNRVQAGHLSQDRLLDVLRDCVRGAVANNGLEYNGYYPIDSQGFLKFGTQGISVDKAVEFLMDLAGMKLQD